MLGVGTKAGADDIRAAWKKKARLAHPDQPGGSEDQFVALGEAYKLLKETGWQSDAGFARPWREGKTGQSAAQPRKAATPKDRRGTQHTAGAHGPRQRVVEGALRGLCARYLQRQKKQAAYAKAARQNGGFYVDPRVRHGDPASGAEHVAAKVAVDAGTVRIHVAGAMAPGQNTVSMPCGTRAEDAPALVRFHARTSGRGRVRVSDAIRARHFPWASCVEIRFAG